ncbi:DUF2000 domain-containing protein [Pseudonocardia yunnanensis]|uniref:DUF2000 domain-containing protein n=1 Tax=Pseudonocardia yunnanensis TaxID=58107 RepID=A0ABW4EP14_9PSEU
MGAEPVPARHRLGYAPDEVVTSEPTRSTRLKWVIVVDETLSAGRAANAVACVAATTGATVEGLIAHGGPDASGDEHPGLPWAGCTILAATPDALATTRAAAACAEGVLVVDMPEAAQSHRVYDDYLSELAETEPEKLACSAVSIIGPRNRVGKLVKRLALLA